MKKSLLVFLVSIVFLAWFKTPFAVAASTSEKALENAKEITRIEVKLKELGKQEKTFKEQIDYMDNQTRLTSLRVEEVKKKLEDLEESIVTIADKIVMVEEALSKLAEVLARRIVATYAYADIEPFELFLGKGGFNEFLNRYKYLQVIQLYDKKLLYQMQATKSNYRDQKGLLEEKQEEALNLKKKMERYKQELAQQKKDKEYLLELTKNDEKKYQEMLAEARAELAALEETIRLAIFKDGKRVEKNEVIGFMGNSGAPVCSRGSHLHFEVRQNGEYKNPADYLKNINPQYDAQVVRPDFKGEWDWPIESPIISQEFGMSYWARVLRFYNGGPHTGIDMYRPEETVPIKAVKEGTLYRGMGQCGVVALNYLAIDHGGEVYSWYFHVK